MHIEFSYIVDTQCNILYYVLLNTQAKNSNNTIFINNLIYNYNKRLNIYYIDQVSKFILIYFRRITRYNL
jgi:hypothetical protein